MFRFAAQNGRVGGISMKTAQELSVPALVVHSTSMFLFAAQNLS
jgi:hypothetical protein